MTPVIASHKYTLFSTHELYTYSAVQLCIPWHNTTSKVAQHEAHKPYAASQHCVYRIHWLNKNFVCFAQPNDALNMDPLAGNFSIIIACYSSELCPFLQKSGQVYTNIIYCKNILNIKTFVYHDLIIWIHILWQCAPFHKSSVTGRSTIEMRDVFSCLRLRQWPVTYLITLSDWIMSCQPGRHAVVTVCEPDWKHKWAAYKSFDETSSFNNLELLFLRNRSLQILQRYVMCPPRGIREISMGFSP